MSKPVKLPDPLHERAKAESERRDISMGAVIEDWKRDADRFQRHFAGEHRLEGAEPMRVPEDAPRDESGDPILQDNE